MKYYSILTLALVTITLLFSNILNIYCAHSSYLILSSIIILYNIVSIISKKWRWVTLIYIFCTTFLFISEIMSYRYNIIFFLSLICFATIVYNVVYIAINRKRISYINITSCILTSYYYLDEFMKIYHKLYNTYH